MTEIPSFEAVMSTLGFSATPPEWPEAWGVAQATYPGEVPFLTEGFVAEVCGGFNCPEDMRQAMLEAAAQVRKSPVLSRFAWFLFQQYFRDPMPPSAEVSAWPLMVQPLPAPFAMIPALVLLGGAPRLRALHATRGVPEDVTRATLTVLAVWMRHFRRQHGYWGIQNISWPLNHFAGQLYRLGRLEFIQCAYYGPTRAFRHRASGRVLALWASTEPVRGDGYVDGTNAVYDPEARVREFVLTPETATGYPVHPRGWVLPRSMTLPLVEWQPVLATGDPVLDIHIPEDGPMDFDTCGDSLRAARDFFARYYPERPRVTAFVCGTWFFDAQYQQLLPPTANIVRVQREFYLAPLLSHDREPYYRVFGAKPADLKTAPRDTTLRRAMLDFTQDGGQLRCACGFCLIDDMAWGSAKYQSGDMPAFADAPAAGT